MKRKLPPMSTVTTDISEALLEPGDLIKFEDSDVPNTFYTVKVVEVKDVDAVTRLVKFQIIDSTTKKLRYGSEITFEITKGQPVMGVLSKHDDNEAIDPSERDQLIAVEAYRFLMAKPESNFRENVTDVVDYLYRSGFLPPAMGAEKRRRYVLNLFKVRRDMFQLNNRYVSATGRFDFAEQPRVAGASSVRAVSMSKLVMGLRLILESGIMGPYVIEE